MLTHVVVLLDDSPVSCALYASSIVYAAVGAGARIIVSLSQFAEYLGIPVEVLFGLYSLIKLVSLFSKKALSLSVKPPKDPDGLNMLTALIYAKLVGVFPGIATKASPDVKVAV